MTVLIADSSPQLTERIRQLIATENDLVSIYSTASHENALQFFVENKPSVVLLGMSANGNGSLDLLRRIRKTGNSTSIIILSIYISSIIKEQCELLGVTVFLDKFLDFDKIPGIINAIAAKEVCP